MIQRIQSLYLFVSIILSILLFFIPFVEILNNEAVQVFSLLSLMTASGEGITLMVINVFLTLLTLLIIFLFNNRERQYRLTRLSILLFGILLAAIFFVTDSYASSLEITGQSISINTGFRVVRVRS